MVLHPTGHDQQTATISEANDTEEETGREETGGAEALAPEAFGSETGAVVATESRADAGPVRLDHAHRALELRARRDEGLVHPGTWLDVQARVRDA